MHADVHDSLKSHAPRAVVRQLADGETFASR